MPLGKRRERVLFGLSKNRPRHRYTTWRWAVAIVFTAATAALPLAGILRFDLWSGHHVYLGEERGLVEVAKAFAFPFLAINIAIILITRFFGRYLCGFVCPVGALGRIVEWMRWHGRSPTQRFLGGATLLAFCAVLSAITFSFWIDWRVFAEGSTAWRAAGAVFLVGLTATLFLGTRRLGLRFCRDLCPSGVYFAVLGPDTTNAIEFAHPEACTECKACEQVCPMDLEPRTLAETTEFDGRGFYPQGLTSFALCIRCGDCVKACEGTTEQDDDPTPLRMGQLPAREPERAV